jgi:hypothetical protein
MDTRLTLPAAQQMGFHYLQLAETSSRLLRMKIDLGIIT